MENRFEIICKKCGARGLVNFDGKNIFGFIFKPESPTIRKTITLYCKKCGNNLEGIIDEPLAKASETRNQSA